MITVQVIEPSAESVGAGDSAQSVLRGPGPLEKGVRPVLESEY